MTLDGASPDHQRDVLQHALDQERQLSRTQLPDQVIETTAMSLADVVDRALTESGSSTASSTAG